MRIQALALIAILATTSCDGGGKAPPSAAPTATFTAGPSPTVSAPASPSASATPTAVPSPTGSAATNDPSAAPDPDIEISGVVRFEGKIPKPGKEDVSSAPDCQAQYSDENPYLKDQLVVNAQRSIKNVLVRVKAGLEGRSFPPPSTPVTVGQKGCRYEPHVFAIVAGQKVQVVNDDGVVHNVHLYPKTPVTPDNRTQKPGSNDTWIFVAPEEPFAFKCDIHPWMAAYCAVLPHPYFAVTGENGAYSLKGLPPGEYVIEAWHEKLGRKTQVVKVGRGQKAAADFTFEAK